MKTKLLKELVKELEELNEHLQEIDDELDEKLDEENKEHFKKELPKKIDEAEEVLLLLTDKGALGVGSVSNMLASVGCYLNKLKVKNDIPVEVLRMMFCDVFEFDEDELF